MVASHRSATLDNWAIDSGASHNYCNNLGNFRQDSVTETNMIIRLGDKSQAQAIKKGAIHLSGVDIEAFLVPDFRISLLSVGQLDFYGYTTTFRSGICSIANTNGRIVLSATLKQGLYILSSDGSAHISEIRSLRTAQHSNTVNIWHQRFAHLNYTDLKRILESNKSRTPWTMPGLYETCVHTKQQQHVIQTKSSRTSTPFELVHSDLCVL